LLVKEKQEKHYNKLIFIAILLAGHGAQYRSTALKIPAACMLQD
jgi:hypothetical protein